MLLWCFLAAASGSSAIQNTYRHLQSTRSGDQIFQLGDVTYLGTTSHPQPVLRGHAPFVDELLPLTVINSTTPSLTGAYLQNLIQNYTTRDDVFSTQFLRSVYVCSPAGPPELDTSAAQYLSSMGTQHLVIQGGNLSQFQYIGGNFTVTSFQKDSEGELPAGPYVAKTSARGLEISKVFRLYEDSYRDFVNGIYPRNGDPHTYQVLDYFDPWFARPIIPVPSRIYFWHDGRPLAGERVGVKDIYDVKGVKTTRGSLAWTRVTTESGASGPAIQRLVDLGAVIVGKQKTAQFATGDEPWNWDDVQPPFNPRGDGYLTCSGSSAGGACSIAAYDWLDFAVGTDTGQSIRRPAAVAGVFGNRPSQGLMTTDGIMAITYATDTAGVFCRDPYKWAKFAENWYTPALHQNGSMTNLPALDSEGNGNPSRLIYMLDYLPMKNPAAEKILQAFIKNLTTNFNMTVSESNFTRSLSTLSIPDIPNESKLLDHLSVHWQYDQIHSFAKPFIQAYADKFNGRYPPMDIAHRNYFREPGPTAKQHTDALKARESAFDIWQDHIFGKSNKTCSESILVYDIGGGGLPSFREEGLNRDPGSTFLKTTGTAGMGGNICSFMGCADFTVPIGQVKYYSNVTFQEEFVPVTVNLAVRRGCDRVLFQLVERMADAGIISGVKTGREAF